MDLTLKSETFGQEDETWVGSAHGDDTTRGITLTTALFTPGTHYPQGFFLSGLPLGRVTATGRYGPYDSAASDGRAVLAGFLRRSVKAPAATTTPVGGALLEHGRVVEARLPLPVDSAGKTSAGTRITFA